MSRIDDATILYTIKFYKDQNKRIDTLIEDLEIFKYQLFQLSQQSFIMLSKMKKEKFYDTPLNIRSIEFKKSLYELSCNIHDQSKQVDIHINMLKSMKI
jgi:hypothetical protein